MSKTTAFSISENDVYRKPIDTNIILHMKQCGSSLAQLYFTDASGSLINIPKGIVVYTYHHITHERIIINPISKTPRYCLCHTDDYEIEYKNEKILTMKPQKGWNLSY